MKRTFAKIEKDGTTWVVMAKDASDFRRWPYRPQHNRHESREHATAYAERSGFILVSRWADAELTPAEEKESGY